MARYTRYGSTMLLGLAMLAPCAALAAFESPEASVASLPLAFERNQGQSDPHVRFVARGGGYDHVFHRRGRTRCRDGSVFGTSLHPRIRPSNGRQPFSAATIASVAGNGELPDRRRSGRPRDGCQDVCAAPAVCVRVPGHRYRLLRQRRARIRRDRGAQRRSSPHPPAIRRRRTGSAIQRRRSDAARGSRNVTFQKPVAYQEIEGRRRNVDARYVLLGDDRVGFRLETSTTRTIRSSSTHCCRSRPICGGAASGVALDAPTISTSSARRRSPSFRTPAAYQTQLAGTTDAYVAKLNPAATAAIYTTYLGARRATTLGLGIAVDSAGSAYVTGTSTGSAFPLTPGAYQSTGSTFMTKLTRPPAMRSSIRRVSARLSPPLPSTAVATRS